MASRRRTARATRRPTPWSPHTRRSETRLRILRRLAEGPATLHELTEILGLAKSTVHGHLLVLRTGGLVLADVSKKTGYRLRRETLAESAALLDTYLEGTEER